MSRNRSDVLAATRAALAWWARLSHGELPGWPKQSIMASALTGCGTSKSLSLPDPVQAVETAVNELYKSEPESRRMILLHYLANGSCRQKIKHLRVSSKTYFARLERAEYAVKIQIGY